MASSRREPNSPTSRFTKCDMRRSQQQADTRQYALLERIVGLGRLNLSGGRPESGDGQLVAHCALGGAGDSRLGVVPPGTVCCTGGAFVRRRRRIAAAILSAHAIAWLECRRVVHSPWSVFPLWCLPPLRRESSSRRGANQRRPTRKTTHPDRRADTRRLHIRQSVPDG